jgi:hypothetical protein|tara:strand:+ start:1918 stop:2163 length:246 start_codon:yes stop_codon:yes gene_type:complete
MGNVIEGDFRDMDSFNNEMETIVDGFVECLTKYYGKESGELMARAFCVSLEEIAERVTKQLELRETEGEPVILFTPDFELP